ncbi:MAG: ATP-binding protein [Candidatus Magnetoovum sp. WYHC-5]|nr:ATP-binding protein [Candidatus Magnetoovum sp. WYHC-5]
MDEPEINLHPKAQMRLLEVVTMAVNKGLYVLITTHSPYFIDHVNNLMNAKICIERDEKVTKDLLEKYTIPEQALIHPDMVSAYYFDEKGNTVDIVNREHNFIDWKSLAIVADELSDISYDFDEVVYEHE